MWNHDVGGGRGAEEEGVLGQRGEVNAFVGAALAGGDRQANGGVLLSCTQLIIPQEREKVREGKIGSWKETGVVHCEEDWSTQDDFQLSVYRLSTNYVLSLKCEWQR